MSPEKIRHLNLIFGDQLTMDSALFDGADPQQDLLWMAEVSGESLAPLSSKQRTVLFLSAMRHFAETLSEAGWRVDYTALNQSVKDFSAALANTLSRSQPEKIRCVLPGDHRVLQELRAFCEQHQLELEILADRHFIAEQGEFQQWIEGRKQPRMENWYRLMRQRHHILMDEQGKPVGGSWNYDKDNRKAFGKNGPAISSPTRQFSVDAITQTVIDEVNTLLPNLPGHIEQFVWPVTREQALQQLEHFIEFRLADFGHYQDAMWTDEPWLFHAHLSSSMNLKLLDPREIINAAEQAYHDGKAPLNAVEGFIRQILGWREYIRGLYWVHREQWPTFNALDAQQPLPEFYWTADTNMQCMAQSVKQVLDFGYGHHIQRLMVTGLFALLWQVKPQEIDAWYLAMYVDAISWVEVPNTLGMSQYADGGIVGSKPYIASGAYINRMSNYCAQCPFDPKKAHGDDACPFTTLYWDFIRQHHDLLSSNPRLGMQARNWDNKSTEEQQAISARALWLHQHIDELKAHHQP
jgi:deoxyribodipyrimidine photolyase-related protein